MIYAAESRDKNLVDDFLKSKKRFTTRELQYKRMYQQKI